MVVDKVNLVKSHVGRALNAGPAKEDARGDRGCWSVITQQQLADTPALVTEGLRFSQSKYYSPASNLVRVGFIRGSLCTRVIARLVVLLQA